LAGAALFGSAQAEAAVVTTDNLAQGVISTNTVYDLDGNGTDDYAVNFSTTADERIVSLQGLGGSTFAVEGNSVRAFNVATTVNSGLTYASADTPILKRTRFSDGSAVVTGQWTSNLNAPKFTSLALNINGGTHYGYMQIAAEVDTPSARVYGWGYDSVAANAVPEPSSFALLALGAAGIAALKRRRKA
jgi:hypothetical protein